MLSGGVMKRRDTFVVPVGERLYEVGREVQRSLTSRQETEMLDENFALSEHYAARLFGALNYLSPGLPDYAIDVLVLGLPLNTYPKHHKALAERFTGQHVINDANDTLQIRSCHVYPQPLGSYMSYVAEHPALGTAPMALSVDPGYNTVDWFVCQGMAANDSCSGAVQRGMGAVLRAIAEDMIKKHNFDATVSELVRRIDNSLATGTAFQLFGRDFDLAPHMGAGRDVIEEAAQSVKNAIGSGTDIDVIILSGGGAQFFAHALTDRFPEHKVIQLENAAHANVRGFHFIGELLARSLQQAMHLQTDVTAVA